MIIKGERDLARMMFEDSGLRYQDITYSNFLLLYWAIQAALEKHNKHQKERPKNEQNYIMQVSKNPKYIKAETGMKEGYIEVNISKKIKREAISFNKDGFIGFAGWADSENIKPIIRAFKHWVLSIYLGQETKQQEKLRIKRYKERLIKRLACIKKHYPAFYSWYSATGKLSNEDKKQIDIECRKDK